MKLFQVMDKICDHKVSFDPETLQETASLYENMDLYVGTPTALPQTEPNANDVFSKESLAGEALLNPVSQEVQDMVSRTAQAEEGTGKTLVPSLDECPICTEPYDSWGAHSVVLLNCDHTVCQCCLATMLKRASDCTRVQCPLCRQKTPLLQWQVYSLQEDPAFHTRASHRPVLPEQSGIDVHAGWCSGLEERLLQRAETARVCGCFEHPRRLIQAIRRMRRRHRCCCVILLLMLYMVELSFLLLVFLPVLILVLLFTLAS